MTHVLAGNLFLSLLFCDIIDNSVPWGHDNWSQQGELQWQGGTVANGGCQRVSGFNVSVHPAAIFAVVNNSISSAARWLLSNFKRCSQRTAQFWFFIIITSAVWLVWYIFLHEWASIKGDGHLFIGNLFS